MARKIILLSDGTGNAASKVWRTNVWRIFESLDLSNSDQVAFYDDGVGTRDNFFVVMTCVGKVVVVMVAGILARTVAVGERTL
jgi:uncharacterized protein (DUF2235 family)